MNDPTANAYRSAFDSVLVIEHQTPGMIELKGADRVDLLHRLSTNDLQNAPSNRVISTVFTDPVARMIDVVKVLTLPDRVYLLTSNGRSNVMQDWLQRHIFFQDDVSVEEIEGWRLYGAYGPKAVDLLDADVPGEGSLDVGDSGITWSVNRPVPGFEQLVGPDHRETGWQATERGADAFEILRIEAGIPRAGSEIQEDSIPLEVGLWDAVSFSKGCYVGQEIIARMESRGKLARQLVGVKLQGHTEPGAVLMQSGTAVGTLTSTANSPRFGWIGLASVQPPKLNEGDDRIVVDHSGIPANIIELPFSEVEAPAPA